MLKLCHESRYLLHAEASQSGTLFSSSIFYVQEKGKEIYIHAIFKTKEVEMHSALIFAY